MGQHLYACKTLKNKTIKQRNASASVFILGTHVSCIMIFIVQHGAAHLLGMSPTIPIIYVAYISIHSAWVSGDANCVYCNSSSEDIYACKVQLSTMIVFPYIFEIITHVQVHIEAVVEGSGEWLRWQPIYQFQNSTTAYFYACACKLNWTILDLMCKLCSKLKRL